MSIIQDALKKAEKQSPFRGNFSIGYAQARKKDIAEIVTVKHGRKMKSRYVAYAIILLALVSIFMSNHFPAFKSKNNFVPERTIARPVEKNIAVIKEPAAPMLPKEPEIRPPEFTLSGIMHLEDGPRALINNIRVAEGDDVDGATVVSITDEGVVLKKQGSEIKLRLK